ncbi:MAG: DUF4878 domain-containing protein [Bacteroidota bacterium]|nr:DUF4878 domain-containing protein [Bacteroidota bacterium]
MYKFIFTAFMFLFFISCNQSSKTKKNTDPLETGREFIDASLKGNYDYAKMYLLPDSTNIMYFDRYKDFDKNMNENEKKGYKNANIIINSAENISDSEMIINYSNTFKNKPSKIRVIKKNNEWLVDFKYTFLGNM